MKQPLLTGSNVVGFGAGNADESENLSRESSFWDEEEDY
jgi:hypothetical protein